MNGLAQTVTFYKGAIERVGVHVDLVRIGAYKGAMEPFVMTEQSPEVRANKDRILDDVFGRIVTSIAADRSRTGHRMDAGDVRAMVDRGLFTPGEARLAGLVDAVADESELEVVLGGVYKRPRVEIREPDPAPLAPAAWPTRRIVVLLVDGTIVDGPSQELPFDLGSVAGSDTLVQSLEECRRDARVGAVVLRVEQPRRVRLRLRRHRPRNQAAPRQRQAGRRVDGRHRRVGRLRHRGPDRRDLRAAVDRQRIRSASSAARSTSRAWPPCSASTSRSTSAARTPTSCRRTVPGPTPR